MQTACVNIACVPPLFNNPQILEKKSMKKVIYENKTKPAEYQTSLTLYLELFG